MISTYRYTHHSPADPHIQALLDYRPSEWSYLLKKIQIIEIFKKFADQSGKSEDYKAIIYDV